jgi:BMFP domain-containing protein YqiC
MAKCSAIAASGNPCQGVPVGGSQWCYHHHPDNASKLSTRGQRGGKRAGRGRPQNELQDIKKRLSKLADDVLHGDVEKSRGAVTSQILNVYLRALDLELKTREQLELIARLEALEAALEAPGDRSPKWSA